MKQTAAGIAALKIVADEKTRIISEAIILAQHGDVPEEFLDQIKGG